MKLLVAIDDLILNKGGGRVTADQTVEFSLAGAVYEIDLTTANVEQMMADLGPYIDAARLIRAAPKPRTEPKRSIKESRRFNDERRTWADKYGYPYTRLEKGGYYPPVALKEAYEEFQATGRVVTFAEYQAAGDKIPDAGAAALDGVPDDAVNASA